MNFDKRTIAAVVLIGSILLIMNSEFYQKRFFPKPSVPAQQAVVQDTTETSSSIDTVATTAIQTPEESTPRKLSSTSQNLSSSAPQGEAKDIIVDTDLYHAVFSTRGATVKSWSLKNYAGPDGAAVQLIGGEGDGDLGIMLPGRQDTLDTSELTFSTNRTSVRLANAGDSDVLTFVLELGQGRQVKKTYTFYQDVYSIDLDVELANLGEMVDGFAYLLTWRSGLNSTEKDFKNDMDNTKGYVYQGEIDNFNISKEPETELFDTATDWVAIRTKYFASAVIPRSSKGQSVLFMGTPVNVQKEAPFKKLAYNLRMQYGQQAKKVDRFTVYMGPLDYDILKGYEIELEDMMDLGYAIFRPFGKLVLAAFLFLHQFIPNYGFVIIVFSILVKIVLYPLTRKSYHSMKQMQALQPMMQELNEKYKDNPQKKQQAVMEMYKEYGVNPLGGCIPMLLQMPLLIALFSIFRSTIELRGADFIWWITDLSRPDTVALLPFSIPLYGNKVNILPLVMGITMFLQQKTTIQDPKQKPMLYFMPLFMTLLFNSFPSGLNLYYALFNILSIVQERVIPHKVKTLEELKNERKEKAKAKPRRLKHDYRGRR